MTIVRSLNQMPDFESEGEEVAFWQTHALSEELWDTLPAVPLHEVPPTRPHTLGGHPLR